MNQIRALPEKPLLNTEKIPAFLLSLFKLFHGHFANPFCFDIIFHFAQNVIELAARNIAFHLRSDYHLLGHSDSH